VAGVELEEQVVRSFLRRLHDADEETKEEIRSSLGESNGSVAVFTARDLSDESRSDVVEALRSELGHDDLEAEFETDADLISGIELRSGGHALGWSLGGYLEAFEEEMEQAVRDSEPRDDE
jgi:F0F1-type ATP synthase delta subunit